MELKNNIMSQLVFKFPFRKKYYEQDFYVSSNNFSAYKLIESWPNWPGKWLNIFGATGSGKTHLSKILEKKINKVKILDEKDVDNKLIENLHEIDCLIIENYQNLIEEKLFYSILNQSKQLDNFIVVNTNNSIQKNIYRLKDLQSRINSFVFIGIELPTDELLQVIISKFSLKNKLTLIQKFQIILLKMSIALMKKCSNL